MSNRVFPIRLKAVRLGLGFSQNRVSKDTGIPQSTISKYETGFLEPNLESLGILARYYQVSIDWLLGNFS